PSAGLGRLGRAARGKAPEALPIAPAAFLRWDLSRDGRWLAAAVQATGQMELRIYDLREAGRHSVWLRAKDVGQPLWSPSGDRLIIDVADSTHSAILMGSPLLGLPPDTIARLPYGPS